MRQRGFESDHFAPAVKDGILYCSGVTGTWPDHGTIHAKVQKGSAARVWAIGLGACTRTPCHSSSIRDQKRPSMKKLSGFVMSALVSGMLFVVPVYLSVLLLLKAMKSVMALVRPLAMLFPEWFPAERLLSLLLVFVVCFLIGAAIRTSAGRSLRERIERSLFDRIPGYATVRSLTQRLAGKHEESVWQPALAEIEDALVPAFIIEELEDGRFTVFVPSVPTPFAGAVYILNRERVHPLDVPFTQALQSVSRWGSGSKELVAAMKTASTRK
jgi:uncharacterized membrane protein